MDIYNVYVYVILQLQKQSYKNPPVLNVLDSLLSIIIVIRFHRSVHIRQFDLSSKIHINS